MVQEKIMNYISSEKYSHKKWLKYTPEEKKKLLSELADYVSKQLGIKTPEIVYEDKAINDFSEGHFYGKTITLYNSFLFPDTTNYVIKVLIHELRHAYQDAAMNNPNLYVVSDETRNEWKSNYTINNYINGGSEGYREQALEWDAVNFANQSDKINSTNRELLTYEGSWTK